uniref:Secreted venom protein family 3 protein n=1 Tax=Pristhesancus plagipennis TaxID=1955184 RepID=A0A2K8JS13_PRIPG|nr:secreted venom protein family 3 protein [Pristhesancus plagipennis]
MYGKLACLLLFVSAISAASLPQHQNHQHLTPHKDECVKGQDHSLKLGTRVNGDRQVYEFALGMSSSNSVLEKDWTFNSDLLGSGETITYLEVLDNEHGQGGCASVVEGGVGQKFVKLHFKTANNGSFNYVVNVYGK